MDIFIPEKNIAIEFNGLYWHSELISAQSGISKYRDYEKYLACREKGIRLISIFEDEWDNQQEIVKSRLKHILSPAKPVTIFARKCAIRPILPKEKNDFLNVYHIQKTDKAKSCLGAFYKDELLAVMTFAATNFTKGGDGSQAELARFATKRGYHLPGIASKLISEFRKTNGSEIISYSDNRWSVGNVYEKIGFTKLAESKPGYFYINMRSNDKSRIHRSNFMKHRLVNIFPDADIQSMIDENLSEWKIMQSLGYDRIWDCGTTKWIFNK